MLGLGVLGSERERERKRRRQRETERDKVMQSRAR
jgi:hypothetical protein